MEAIPRLEGDDFLLGQREVIERGKLKMIKDQEGYQAWLTDLATEFSSEAIRRNLERDD